MAAQATPPTSRPSCATRAQVRTDAGGRTRAAASLAVATAATVVAVAAHVDDVGDGATAATAAAAAAAACASAARIPTHRLTNTRLLDGIPAAASATTGKKIKMKVDKDQVDRELELGRAEMRQYYNSLY